MMQAGNLYMFVLHNPVFFTDPFGLYAVSKGAGIFPWNRTPTPIPPITMTRDGDNITINAFVRIWGSGADLFIPGSDVTFRQAVINGIVNEWGGERGGLNVSVNVVDISQGAHWLSTGQRSLSIEIVNDAGVSNQSGLWSLVNPGRITLYTMFYHGGNRSVAQVERTSAHEFGHSIGVLDGIGFGYRGNTRHGDIVSLMSSMWYEGITGATRLDLELAWHAQTTGRRRAWTHRTVQPIINTHGIIRER